MHDPGTRIDTTLINPAGPASDDLSFRADAVMPTQFYPARPGSASGEPIMRLMAGILIDAVRCFQNNFEARHPSRRQEFMEARLWIFDDRGPGPFSFRSVCDSLEVDPRGLRNWIVRWQEKSRSGERQHMIRRSRVNIAKRMQSRRGNHYREAIEGMLADSEKRSCAGRPHNLLKRP
jgi:hypothetical protein